MKADEIIILAGGLGTRIQPVLGNTPKCLAPIGKHPFLYYLIRYYQRQGIQRFIFSLGHGNAAIEHYLSQYPGPLTYTICHEDAPLGTGGAIARAMLAAERPSVWVANGDSFLAADLAPLESFFNMCGAEAVLALTEVADASRFGSVTLDNSYRVTGFREKGEAGSGWVNAGIYLLNKRLFSERDHPDRFSFEQDYLGKLAPQARFFGYRYKGYFIDIGYPSDLQKAQNELIQYVT